MENHLNKYLYLIIIIIAVVVNIVKSINKNKNKNVNTSKKNIFDEFQKFINPEASVAEINDDYADSYEEELEDRNIEKEYIEEIVDEDVVKVSPPKKVFENTLDSFNRVNIIHPVTKKEKNYFETTTEQEIQIFISPEEFEDIIQLKKAFIYSEIFRRKEY